jgi:myo-inositol-1(or 4)-monophosphatase
MFKNYSSLNKKLFNKFNFIRWGTDALGYMRCAEGIIDAVIERDIKIWDIAAVIPIIKASGGIITTWDNKLPGTNDTVIACNDKKLHQMLVNTLQNYL